ncbi:MAG: class I SAM-dependent methyltransferase [Bacteroidia bacterium]
MKANYSYLVSRIEELGKHPDDLKILDYGCGGGEVVEQLISLGYNAYGCEYFGPGSGTNIKEKLTKKGLLPDKVHIITEVDTGFEDDFFDVVLSNQVFEHIPDIKPVLKEIHRVLKPNGAFINVFPHKGTVREAHCHIPYAHRLPQKSKILYFWLVIFKKLGFGRRKKEKDASKWAHFWMDWIPANTHYINKFAVYRSYSEHFQFKEESPKYLAYRLRKKGWYTLAKWATNFSGLSRAFTHALGGLVLFAVPKK